MCCKTVICMVRHTFDCNVPACAHQVPDARRLARLQLEAQLHYRLGNNKQAIKVYRELFTTHKVGGGCCHGLLAARADLIIVLRQPSCMRPALKPS